MAKTYTNYYGLIFGCPIGVELSNCDFKAVRQLKTKDRIAYYDDLTEQEKEELIKKHQRCLSAREKKTLFHESQ